MFSSTGVMFHLETAYLFVRSDIKTILFPVSGFAFMVSNFDITSTRVFLVPIWVLSHLFLIDIDNQSLSIDEDRINKPWRPLPSGRISVNTAANLSKAMNVICIFISCILGGKELMIPSALFCGLVYIYDHLSLNSNYFWKNLINGLGYAVLETGATTVLVGSLPRQSKPIVALLLSFFVIFTTVHVQDLADTDGDREMGRQTATIHLGQDATRVSLAIFLTIWSFVLPWIWNATELLRDLYALLGIFLSLRIWARRQKTSDERSFRIYNIWLMLGHLLVTAPTIRL